MRRFSVVFLFVASLAVCGGQATGTDRIRSPADAQVAGLQVALAARGFYRGPIDGLAGPSTRAAFVALQRKHGLPASGVADARTRLLLGPLGRPRYMSRILQRGMVGLDVSALQFELHQHGLAVRARGFFDRRTRGALIRFQLLRGLTADGVAGPATYRALAAPPPGLPRLRPPLSVATRRAAVRDGVELFCPYASAVAAAIAGKVTFAGNRGPGFGYTVVTRDRRGARLLYAHLARIDVHVGQRLIPGAMIGLAGWTGKRSERTSLLLELSLRGARLEPSALLKALH